jgi:AcrR family transcriptional regulator
MTDQSSSPQQPGGTVQSDAIVGAFMALLADKRIEDIGFAEIARRAGVSLSTLPCSTASTPAWRTSRRASGCSTC